MSAGIVTRRRLLHWYQPGYCAFYYVPAGGIDSGDQVERARCERADLIRQAGSLPYDVRAERRSEIDAFKMINRFPRR